MNTTQLECFVIAAETLSFSETARRLNLSQPSVSRQISSLEEELNAKLLARTTKSVHLTLIGERFLADARRILRQVNDSVNWIHSYTTVSPYAVRIGYTEASDLDLIARALKTMRESYPNVSAELICETVVQNLSHLSNDETDAVFGLDDLSLTDNMSFFPLAPARLVCIVPENHPLYEKKSVKRDDMAHCDTVVYLPSHMRNSSLVYRNTARDGALTSGSSSSEAIALVKAGLGCCILPECFVKPDPSYHLIPVSDSSTHHYGIYYRRGGMIPALKCFADACRAQTADHSGSGGNSGV